MKQYFFNNNSKTLILFFCGWGMDEKPFKPLKTKYDMLLVYNYSELSLDFDFEKYEEIHFLSYSYGVFMGAFLKDKLPELTTKTAVNGTLKPVDKDYGIPGKIFDLTLGHMTLETAIRFRERLFNNTEHFRMFNRNLPHRELEDSLYELARLKEYFKDDVYYDYNRIYIGEEDKIIPAKNQKKYWIDSKNHPDVKIIKGGHFPFYNYEFIEDLIEQ